MARCLLAAAVVTALATAAAAHGAPRAASLDQCADQYVLALSDPAAIVGLSYRAGNGDSALAPLARGLPRVRASAESLLTVRPQVVVRYWGGDAGLTRALQAHGARVVTLAEAKDFDGVRANIRAAAAALGEPDRGEALIADMDRTLAAARAHPSGRTALYLTPGAATAGPGTLVDAMLRAGGMINAEQRPGYSLVSLEQLALQPPAAVALGFFDAFSLGRSWWGPDRSPVVRRLTQGRAIARLPGAWLGCPAWFAAGGSLALSKAAAS